MIRPSVSYCPVPIEQQPLNEYEQLKTSWLFCDCILNRRDYITRLVGIWSLSWLVAGPVAAASFPLHKHLVHFLLCGSAGASVGVILVLARLFLGWLYIRDRLYNPTVFYEESGWYDGQTWTKPQEVIMRDRLIVSYEIKPILQRLTFTAAVLAGMFAIGTIVWQFS